MKRYTNGSGFDCGAQRFERALLHLTALAGNSWNGTFELELGRSDAFAASGDSKTLNRLILAAQMNHCEVEGRRDSLIA